MPDPVLVAIPFLVAAGVGSLPAGMSLRLGAVGTSFVTLGTLALARTGSAPASFATINNVLLWCGVLLGGMAVVAGWRAGGRASLLPLAAALIVAIAATASSLGAGHVMVSLLAGIAGAAAMVALPSRSPEPAQQDTPPQGRVLRVLRRWGMPVLLGALLIPAAWFTFTVAGPDARSLRGLRDAPFSPAGETLFAALLLPASLVLAGAWPFGRLARGPRLAPLAALLLVAIVAPMAGDGLAHWRSLYAAWLVAGAMVAAFVPRWPVVMACGGLFVIACGGQAAFLPGSALTVIASALSLRPATGGPLLRAAYLAAGACVIAGLRATLANEVVYSVLMLLMLTVAVLRTPLSAVKAP